MSDYLTNLARRSVGLVPLAPLPVVPWIDADAAGDDDVPPPAERPARPPSAGTELRSSIDRHLPATAARDTPPLAVTPVVDAALVLDAPPIVVSPVVGAASVQRRLAAASAPTPAEAAANLAVRPAHAAHASLPVSTPRAALSPVLAASPPDVARASIVAPSLESSAPLRRPTEPLTLDVVGPVITVRSTPAPPVSVAFAARQTSYPAEPVASAPSPVIPRSPPLPLVPSPAPEGRIVQPPPETVRVATREVVPAATSSQAQLLSTTVGPQVNVRIGTIEIHATEPAPVVAPSPPPTVVQTRVADGFERHARLRSYAPWGR